MLRYLLFQFGERVGIRLRLGGQQRALLRLAARALKINHKHPSDVYRDFSSGILLD
jgi:hypothetical protein